jgi:hypothetical protein
VTELLTTREVADIRRKTPEALRQERVQVPYQGPPFIRDGRRVLYPKDLLEEWLADRVVGRRS